MKSRTLYASNPTQGDVARFQAEATQLIKAKLEVEFNLDPRQPMSVGQLAAICRGLELRADKRADIQLPTGEKLDLMAVSAREAGKGDWTYLGNELRLGGVIVSQRLRSPEASQAFKSAKSSEGRFEKSANLFLANWRDETVVDKETARRTVTLAFPSDMTAGISYRLSWYCRDRGVAGRPGHVDLRAALASVCQVLDEGDAKAKAKAEAEITTAKAVVNELRYTPPRLVTVAALRARAKELNLAGLSKATKAELRDAIEAAAGLLNWEPEEKRVRADLFEAITIASNMVDVGGAEGELRLKRALRAAGIRVPVATVPAGQLAEAGAYKARLVAQAKACRCAEETGDHDEADEAEVEVAGVVGVVGA